MEFRQTRAQSPEKNRCHRNVLVVIDNLSQFGWTISLKIKNAQTKKNYSETFLINSTRKANFFETDRVEDIYDNILQKFLNNKNIKQYSRNSFLGAVFAEIFNSTRRDLLKNVVFERRVDNWIDNLPTLTKQYNNRTHSSTKLTHNQASSKERRIVYQNILYKREKVKAKFKVHDLFITTDLKKAFSKSDTTN